jgi:GNAT superfamily N-acetyltransferase
VTVLIDAGNVIQLDACHLAGALALSHAAHWNQVEADWSMMIAAGTAIGIEDSAGQLIASAVTLAYGQRFGWISMVLVAPARRKRGLARRLLEACIEHLRDQRLAPVLDATPEGEKLYRSLGFEPLLGYRRWRHDAVQEIALKKAGRTTLVPVKRETVFAIDANVFGGQRPIILDSLIQRSGNFSAMDAKSDGYVLGRDGRTACQIGPISAADPDAALALLDHALANITGAAIIDAGDHQTEFVRRLEDFGFRPQRPFLRMAKGLAKSPGTPANIFALAGPELG